ncbi:hypothetical protein ElyMa_002052100 [Elysia marginata]|uniref:GDNF/GAS1 domain-containing protein n=1 Tax=Elysia marginata TaxID=1093978 RepID=A0AAV4F856_9GAST|nr:hypothetical protein ElyMa_002052100 [Elysia marginata]
MSAAFQTTTDGLRTVISKVIFTLSNESSNMAGRLLFMFCVFVFKKKHVLLAVCGHCLSPRQCSVGEPCRTKLEMRSVSGKPLTQMPNTPCSCQHEETCSDDWSQTDRTLTSTLEAPGLRTALNLMFCQPLKPKHLPTCADNEVAVVLSSYLQIPTNLKSLNCRCGDDSPLQLSRRWMKNYQYFHNYVCGSSLDECSADKSCMTVKAQETVYHCRCPQQTHCATAGRWGASTTSLDGYCVEA